MLRELESANQQLEAASAEEVITWAAGRFGQKLTMGTAFGPEGMVILHMLSSIAPVTPVFNLDTGYQFPETLAMQQRVRERYGIQVTFERSQLTTEQFESAHGGPVYKSDPTECCFQRKMSSCVGPSPTSPRGSAIRPDQSPDRARAPMVGWDRKFGLVKVNPLANWTKQMVWKFITDNEVPYNPLHDQGFMSIGCQPCTRAVLFGEDRAFRTLERNQQDGVRASFARRLVRWSH